MRLTFAALAVTSVLLGGCNSAPVKPESLATVSVTDVGSNSNPQELAQLRAQLKTHLDGKLPADYAEDYAVLAAIDARLLALREAEVTQYFSEKRLENGFVPQPAILALSSRLGDGSPIPAEKWKAIDGMIALERGKTEQEVGKQVSSLASETDVKAKLTFLGSLYALTGDTKWQAERDSIVNALVVDIRQASQSEEFTGDIQEKVELVREIKGDDSALVDELIGVDAKIYAKRFFDALGDGNADKAYGILVQMSEANDFVAIKGKLAATSQKMAEFFTAQADESVKSVENLAQSFQRYSQARTVRKLLDIAPLSASHFSPLSDQLFNRYEALVKEDELGAALGHLYAIRTFQPNRSGLRKRLSEQEGKVRDLAVKRLSTTDFQSPYKDQDYGDVISSFITQYLFEHVPHDVRIVEREQYEAILRERGLSGDTSSLSSVNLLVSGSVLESKVDSTEAKNKKQIRVEVGKEQTSNPAYISWLKQGEKGRKGVEKPAEVIEVSKYENISVGVTRHRKIGIFSVSYRLVEASSGRVVFPDSITTSKQYEDESSEGVEMGDFVIPFKLADLPSDVEILDELARQVATDIGEKLVGELKDQDLKYLAKAATSVEQNDCVGEVQSLANALMIQRLKSLSGEETLGRFKSQAVKCFN